MAAALARVGSVKAASALLSENGAENTQFLATSALLALAIKRAIYFIPDRYNIYILLLIV
jgi:hypothetical protein